MRRGNKTKFEAIFYTLLVEPHQTTKCPWNYFLLQCGWSPFHSLLFSSPTQLCCSRKARSFLCFCFLLGPSLYVAFLGKAGFILGKRPTLLRPYAGLCFIDPFFQAMLPKKIVFGTKCSSSFVTEWKKRNQINFPLFLLKKQSVNYSSREFLLGLGAGNSSIGIGSSNRGIEFHWLERSSVPPLKVPTKAIQFGEDFRLVHCTAIFRRNCFCFLFFTKKDEHHKNGNTQ